jgi:integrase
MGRHKLPYKLKKPNIHHKYWRYALSTDPKGSEISARTKVKYEAERIAKEAYIRAVEKLETCPTFEEYAKDFFTPKCKYTARRIKSNHSLSPDVLKLKRSKLVNYLLPHFGQMKISDITRREFEDWRMTLEIANSTNNDITIVMKQIMGEAVRDEFIPGNPLDLVEHLSKSSSVSKDVLTVEEMKKIFPLDMEEAIKIWTSQKYFTIIFLLTSSGMRSGEVRALKWNDVDWDNNGIMITKAMKNSGAVGCVKENKNKIVRLPLRTIELLKLWKEKSEASGDDDYIFYGKDVSRPIDRKTISSNFTAGLKRAKVGKGKNLTPHSLRHTFNSYMLTAIPSDVVRKFTGHSSENMTNHYYHPYLQEELKATQQYQEKINTIWDELA